MFLNPRALLIIGTVLIFLLGGLLAMYSPVPGNLASAHASLSGMSTIGGCTRCHTGSGIAGGCLECHTEIDAQLKSGNGFHHFLLEGDVECASCHREHMGEDFRLVNESSWGAQVFRAFRHPHVEFTLVGKHADLACESCHLRSLSEPFVLPAFADFPRPRSFLGLDQNCDTCHEDVHANGLSGDCATCHGQEAFRPPAHFNHADHFPLEGGHERLSCAECHVIPPPETPRARRPFPFHQVRGTTCSGCHDSPHRVFVGNCDHCHLPLEPLWSSAVESITPKIHELTGFRLNPPHSEVACEDCHPRELPFAERYHDPHAPGYLRGQDTCQGCHGDVHDGQFLERSRQCLDCHQRLRFVPSTFGHTAHASVYPLTGAHEAVACNACHRMDQERQVRRFVGTSTRCRECHRNPHGRQFLDRIESRDCTACHRRNVDTFRIRPFDHKARTGHALEGAHASADCTGCHVEVLEPFGGVFERVRRYEGTPTLCSGCHKDVHRGQFQHYGEESCSVCHGSFSSWTDIRFDHDTQSRFPLGGAHATLECSRCHLLVALEDGTDLVQYRPLGRECNDCHVLRSE